MDVILYNKIQKTEKALYDLRKVENVTPTVITGLDFVNNGTAYATSSGFEVAYFKLKKNTLYHIEVKNTSLYSASNSISFRHIISTNVPSNGVSGTFIREKAIGYTGYFKIDYLAQTEDYFGIAHKTDSKASVSITCESGDIVPLLRNEIDFEPRYLAESDFEQGSYSYGIQFYSTNDCVTEKEFRYCAGADKLYFEQNDASGPWKIRVIFVDENCDTITQVGYDFLSEINIPSHAKYLKIAISHYNSSGTSSVTTNSSSVKPNTLKVTLRGRAESCKDLSDSEYDQIEENGYGYLHADFITASLARGNVYIPSSWHRVTTYKKFRFDRDVILVPDSGFRFGVHSFGTSGESFVSDSGWKTEPYLIPANTYFRIVLHEVALSTSTGMVADINKTVKAVKVTTKLTDSIDAVSGIRPISNKSASNINYAVNNNDSHVFSSASGYVSNYYPVDAGKTYNVKVTMGASAGYIRYVFSEKIPAANVSGELLREIYYKANQISEFNIKMEHSGYFSIVNHNLYPYTPVVSRIGLVDSKADKMIPEGLTQYAYTGEKIVIDHHVAPEYLFVLADGIPIVGPDEKNRARQGASVYGDILFVGYNGAEVVTMHDLRTKRMIATVTLNAEHVSNYHCNNLNFGTEKYDESDPFPLMYISQEGATARKTVVYRITENNGTYSATLVQTITYPPQSSDGMYYPNGFLDNDNGFFYIHGYTENSFYKSATNKIKIVKYQMPKLSDGDVQLNYNDRLSEFVMDSYTATQGSIVRNNKMYQCNGYGETDNNIVQNSLTEGRTVTSISLINMGIVDEPEAAFIWNDSLCFYTVRGYVYKLHFD